MSINISEGDDRWREFAINQRIPCVWRWPSKTQFSQSNFCGQRKNWALHTKSCFPLTCPSPLSTSIPASTIRGGEKRLTMDSGCTMVWEIIGPGAAGAVFSAGWWFWVDAVVCSGVKISFIHYLPGIFASLAALMFNCVRKEDLSYDYYSPYGESDWRLKLWLFLAYVVSFVSLAAAVGLLVQDALTNKGVSVWTGIAGVLQCVFILISGLIYWTCHSDD